MGVFKHLLHCEWLGAGKRAPSDSKNAAPRCVDVLPGSAAS